MCNCGIATEIATGERRIIYCPMHAAAPDLLAALQFVFEHIGDPQRQYRDLYPAFGLDSGKALEIVRAAIVKAEVRER